MIGRKNQSSEGKSDRSQRSNDSFSIRIKFSLDMRRAEEQYYAQQEELAIR